MGAAAPDNGGRGCQGGGGHSGGKRGGGITKRAKPSKASRKLVSSSIPLHEYLNLSYQSSYNVAKAATWSEITFTLSQFHHPSRDKPLIGYYSGLPGRMFTAQS
jgi:hypothetical protein